MKVTKDKEDNPSPGSKEKQAANELVSSVNQVSVGTVFTNFGRSINLDGEKITSLVSLASN